jgi:ATP-dependent DNA helicase RecQ
MQVQVLTLRYDPTRGVIDETPLCTFSRDKVILAVRDHFFSVGTVPHLALVVEYRLPEPSQPDGTSGTQGQGRPRTSTDDLRAQLDPGTRERFDLLRTWRSGVARDEAVPAYAVLTNKQLVAIAREEPATKAGLLRTQGLGKKKAERYAAGILAALGTVTPAEAPVTAAAAGEDS